MSFHFPRRYRVAQQCPQDRGQPLPPAIGHHARRLSTTFKHGEIAMPDNTSKPSYASESIDAANQASEAPRPAWTIMVYLAGDNNLADECVFALTEMKAAMVDPNIRVVAQFDPTARRLKTKRFVLNRALHQNGNGNKPSGKLPAVVDSEAWRHRKSIIDDVVPEGLPPGKIPFRENQPIPVAK
jgi:hypothetical protein